MNRRVGLHIGLFLLQTAFTGHSASAQEDPAGQIAFYSLRNGRADIYVVNADGSDLRWLTEGQRGGKCPTFSPDGTLIAFQSDGGGNEDIYVMRADGTDVRRLTDSPSHERQAAWSPDGSRIAFQSDRDGNPEIYLMNTDGSHWRRVTFDAAQDMWPSWSPDGREIAFNSNRDGNWEIYVASIDGLVERRITDSELWELQPAWSPDGTRIAFRSGRGGVFEGDIHTIQPDGTDERKLTEDEGMEEDPTWSPGGTQIAFQSMRDDNFEIYIMDSDGGEWRNLTQHPAHDYWPKWARKPGEVTAQPMASRLPASDVMVQVVYDDRTSGDDLETDAGFAVLVSIGEDTLLFDTGADGPTLQSNMARLGINPKGIDKIVISHNHSDHIGGLLRVVEQGSRPEVLLPAGVPDNMTPRAQIWVAALIDSTAQHVEPVISVTDPVQISEGVRSTGLMGTRIPEHALIIELEGGLIVITGCAHPGVVDMVTRAKELAAQEVLLVLGGFHLDGRDLAQIQAVASELADLTRFVSPCHCSGDEARETFRRMFGERYLECGVGQAFRSGELTGGGSYP